MTPNHYPENRRRQDDTIQREVERVTAIVQARLHPAKIAGFVALASLLGAALPVLASFLGVSVFGPGAAAAATSHRVDSVAVMASKRIDSVEYRLSNIEQAQSDMRELFTAYVASSCLDANQLVRLRQALVPCRRLLDERGVLR